MSSHILMRFSNFEYIFKGEFRGEKYGKSSHDSRTLKRGKHKTKLNSGSLVNMNIFWGESIHVYIFLNEFLMILS